MPFRVADRCDGSIASGLFEACCAGEEGVDAGVALLGLGLGLRFAPGSVAGLLEAHFDPPHLSQPFFRLAFGLGEPGALGLVAPKIVHLGADEQPVQGIVDTKACEDVGVGLFQVAALVAQLADAPFLQEPLLRLNLENAVQSLDPVGSPAHPFSTQFWKPCMKIVKKSPIV